jgi:hypothetical protein
MDDPTKAPDNHVKTYDELLAELPSRVRPHVAAARNTHIRVREHRLIMLDESKKLKAQLRKLRHGDNLSPYKIALLLDMSRTRVLQILGERQPTGPG